MRRHTKKEGASCVDPHTQTHIHTPYRHNTHVEDIAVASKELVEEAMGFTDEDVREAGTDAQHLPQS